MDMAKRQLELKVSAYRNKYKDLVKVVSDHEKKIEKFVSIINSVNYLNILIIYLSI
jgi:hypothetical protein